MLSPCVSELSPFSYPFFTHLRRADTGRQDQSRIFISEMRTTLCSPHPAPSTSTIPLRRRLTRASSRRCCPISAKSMATRIRRTSYGRKAEQAVEDARDDDGARAELPAVGDHLHQRRLRERQSGPARRGAGGRASTRGRSHLITTPVEHSAILKTVAQLAELMGFEQTILPVDRRRVDRRGGVRRGAAPGYGARQRDLRQ